MIGIHIPGSTGRCNACVIRPQQGVGGFGRRSPARRFAWPPVQGRGRGCEVVRTVQAQVGAIREILLQQPVGVLVRPLSP